MALLQKEKSNEVNVGTPNSESGSGIRGIGNTFKFLPKIEFPGFDGFNPSNWIKKCGRYFTSCKVPKSQ